MCVLLTDAVLQVLWAKVISVSKDLQPDNISNLTQIVKFWAAPLRGRAAEQLCCDSEEASNTGECLYSWKSTSPRAPYQLTGWSVAGSAEIAWRPSATLLQALRSA